MPDVYDYATEYREELLSLDAKAARRMADAYRSGYKVMQDRLRSVTALIEDAKSRGEEPEGRWLFQQERWKQFYNGMRDEIESYNKVAKGITTDAQGDAIGLGTKHMGGLLKHAFGGNPEKYMGSAFTFNKPNDRAMRAMVGFTAAGAPLSDLFGRISPEAQKMAIDTMQKAVSIGANPAVTARMMQGPLGIPMWRSLTIARTETLRAYREAQRQTVLENADVLEGWTWHSARDARTCEVCWSMHGKVFSITDAGELAPVVEPVPVDLPPDPSSFEERYAKGQKVQKMTKEEADAARDDARAAEKEYSQLVANWRAKNGGALLPRPSDPFKAKLYDEAKWAYDEMVKDGLSPEWNGALWYGPLTSNARYNRPSGIMHVGDSQMVERGTKTLWNGQVVPNHEVIPTPDLPEIDRRATIFHEIAHSTMPRGVLPGGLDEGVVDGYTAIKFPAATVTYAGPVATLNGAAAAMGVDQSSFYRTLLPLDSAQRTAQLRHWANESSIDLSSLGLKNTDYGLDFIPDFVPVPRPSQDPARAAMDAFREKYIERSIAENMEYGAIIDYDTGKVLVEKKGVTPEEARILTGDPLAGGAVNFTDDEARFGRGNIMTHTHPSRYAGFSDGDLAVGARGFRRVVAESGDWTWEMEYPPGWLDKWNESEWAQKNGRGLGAANVRLRTYYEELMQSDLMDRLYSEMEAGKRPKEDIEALTYHEMMVSISEQMGWSYKRTKRELRKATT